MNVHVSIVTFNSAATIEACINSIITQTHRARIIIIDNASTDTTIDIIEKKFLANSAHSATNIRIIKNKTNRGFAAGHNQAIHASALTSSDAVLVLNPDVILEPTYIEHLVAALAQYPSDGIVAGRLFRWDIQSKQKTTIIDSDGLKIYSDFHVIDRNAGKHEPRHAPFIETMTTQQTTKRTEAPQHERVFGVSGAACLIRATVLTDIAYNNEYFDENFFIYKEDVDLCWRIWITGWNAALIPSATGYHVRGVKTNPKPKTLTSAAQILASRTSRSKIEQFHSFKNQHLLVLKNVFISALIRNLFSVILYEIKLLILMLFFKPFLIKSFIAYIRLIPRTWAKRRHIMKRSKRTFSDFQSLLKLE